MQRTARYWFLRYARSYRDYARQRGFNGALDDGPFFRRAFVQAWAEPGFHRFWRTWNPGVSFFAYRLYRLLGGARRRKLATVGAFVGNGIAHNLLTLPWFQRWSWTLPTAFLAFGLLTIGSRSLATSLRQETWPTWSNVGLNIGLVACCFDLGFRVDAAF